VRGASWVEQSSCQFRSAEWYNGVLSPQPAATEQEKGAAICRRRLLSQRNTTGAVMSRVLKEEGAMAAVLSRSREGHEGLLSQKLEVFLEKGLPRIESKCHFSSLFGK
jgi:hypothetical protein